MLAYVSVKKKNFHFQAVAVAAKNRMRKKKFFLSIASRFMLTQQHHSTSKLITIQ